MNDREKLIMLLGDDTCHRECSECEYHENENACIRYLKESLADHLLANGVTVQKWIPVTERLPEESDADDAMGVYAVHKRSLKRYWHFASVKDNPFDFTYWMPLPLPPEEGGAENG